MVNRKVFGSVVSTSPWTMRLRPMADRAKSFLGTDHCLILQIRQSPFLSHLMIAALYTCLGCVASIAYFASSASTPLCFAESSQRLFNIANAANSCFALGWQDPTFSHDDGPSLSVVSLNAITTDIAVSVNASWIFVKVHQSLDDSAYATRFAASIGEQFALVDRISSSHEVSLCEGVLSGQGQRAVARSFGPLNSNDLICDFTGQNRADWREEVGHAFIF